MKTCYIPSPFSPLNGAPRKALDLRNFSQDDEGIPPASDLGAWQSGLNFTFTSSSHYCIIANTTSFVREVTNFAGIDTDSFAFPDDVRFQCLRIDPANNRQRTCLNYFFQTDPHPPDGLSIPPEFGNVWVPKSMFPKGLPINTD